MLFQHYTKKTQIILFVHIPNKKEQEDNEVYRVKPAMPSLQSLQAYLYISDSMFAPPTFWVKEVSQLTPLGHF